ncbi:F5/8 type C domain-containing protein [Lachnospiraceae bacterium]|nr:F5/8 type C domain-containing protein [Lachnospiraceae bacterium]
MKRRGLSRKILTVFTALAITGQAVGTANVFAASVSENDHDEMGVLQDIVIDSDEKEDTADDIKPYYEFDFENELVSGNKVYNRKNLDGEECAEIGGKNAEIIFDKERGSDVLFLPGGTTSSGYLTLPDDMFMQGLQGFTLSFWVKAAADGSSSTHYQRIFESSPTELGKYYQGVTGSWADPEFTFVIGGGDEADTRYDACINTSDKTKGRLEWGRVLGSGKWDYVTVSVTPDSYNVYINGNSISVADLSGNKEKALKGFFEEIGSFKNSSLGQSVYTSDANARAYFDDFRFYRTALTEEEAKAIYTDEYKGEKEEEIDYGDKVALEFDTTDSKGDMFHGSTGFLYGISEVGVPSYDLVSALKPGILIQKAPDGKQHPSGDAYRLTDYLKNAGVKNIQIYLQDYYLEWPYEYSGIDDYQAKVEKIVKKNVAGKSDEEKAMSSYVLFNEPDQIWYSSNGSKFTSFCKDWKTIYDTVKEIDPDAKTAGPNFASFNVSSYENFFKYCAENNCLPEIITWHDLAKGKLTGFYSELASVKSMVSEYYKNSGIEPKIFVNETVNFEDIGVPGTLVNWLSIYEENDTYASLPYWGLANSLNELAAGENEPNSAWWVYRWYAEMQGYKTSLKTFNINNPSSSKKGDRLYGLCSVDEDNETVMALFGGHKGEQNITLKNIGKLAAFNKSEKVHVKIYRSRYSGQQGFSIPDVVVDEDFNIGENRALSLVRDDCDLMDAYFAVITPSEGKGVSGKISEWMETYEAEDAELLGSAASYTRTGGSDLARSNRADVGGIYSEQDGVKFTVDVPSDGKYTAKIYYSVAAPYVDAKTLEIDPKGQNRAIGKLVQHKLVVDDDSSTEQILTYASTVKSGYYNYAEAEVSLTAGTHTLTFTHYGASQKNVSASIRVAASLDKLDLVHNDAETAAEGRVSFEEMPGESYKTGHTMEGYTGNGYVTGNGSIEVVAAVPEDGLYDVDLKYAVSGNASVSLSKKVLDYGKDASAKAELGVKEILLADKTLSSSDENFVSTSLGKVSLKAGINTLVINSDKAICLDEMVLRKDEAATEGASVTFEAENGTVNGNVKVITNDHASGSRLVDGIGGGDVNSTLTMEVDAPTDGMYTFSMFYTNDEPAPVMKTKSGAAYVHPYNTDLVERYAQISVNGKEPETVYFRNTFSWDVIRNQILDVELKAGKNKIVFSNDNSYKFSELQDDYAPRFDKFVITPVSVDSDYVPEIDKTALYKAIQKAASYYADNYTKSSYEKLNGVRQAAEKLYSSENPDKEEISEVIDELNSAELGLVSLVSIRNTLANLKNYDEAEFTASSWKKLLKSKKAAESMISKNDAGREEVDSAEQAVKDAVSALKEKYPLINNSEGTVTSDANKESHPEYAWNGDSSTYPDLVDDNGGWNSAAAWTQIAFEEEKQISRISFANRSGFLDRLVGGVFYGSNDGKNYDELYTIKSAAEGYNTILFEEPVSYRYIRYNSPANCYLNIADIRLYGMAVEDKEDDNNDDPAVDPGNDPVVDPGEGKKEDPAEEGKENVFIPATPENDVITDSMSDALLVAGKTYKINLSFSLKKYVLDKNEKKIISVSRKGKVKVKKSGIVTLEAIGKNGESKTFTIYAEKPKAVKKSASVGDSFNVSELVSGVNYSKPVSVKSGNPKIASVDANGKVTILKKGTVKISISYGSKKTTINSRIKIK